MNYGCELGKVHIICELIFKYQGDTFPHFGLNRMLSFTLTLGLWFQEHQANFCMNWMDPIHQANFSFSEMNQ